MGTFNAYGKGNEIFNKQNAGCARRVPPNPPLSSLAEIKQLLHTT